MSKREKPTQEALDTYAAGFNESEALRFLGIVVDFPDLETIRATIDPVTDAHRGGLGAEAINGLVMSSLFDLVIGASVALVDPRVRSATMNLNVNFLSPTFGERVEATAKVDRAGKTVCFSSGVVRDGAGNVTATAQGVVKISQLPWLDGASPTYR